MDLGKFLRDRKKDVNKRWQNSIVLDAVSSNTKADQARRAQQGPRTINQQASDTYGGGFSAPVNRVRDLFDANTKADAMKRLASTGLNESYQDQQNRLTNEAVNTQSNRSGVNQFAAGGLKGFVNRVTKAPGDIGNLVGAAANTNVLDNVPVVGNLAKLNKVTGNKFGQQLQDTSNQRNKVIDQKINQSQIGERKGDNRLITGAGQVITDLPFQAATGGAGLAVIGANTASDEYNRAREAGKSNDAALNIGILQGGASALSEKVGMDRFLPGNGVTGNVLQKAANRFITEGAQEGQQQFTQNLIANKSYNPNQSLKEGVAESALLGALAGGVASPALDYASNVGAPPQVKQDVVRQNPVLQQTGIPAQPGSIRERIQMAKEAVTNKIAGDSSVLRPEQVVRDPAVFDAVTDRLQYLDNPSAYTTQEVNAMNQALFNASQQSGRPLTTGSINDQRQALKDWQQDNGQAVRDNEVEAAVERGSVRDYFRSKQPVKGDATTGEGAQLPGEGMTPKQRQSFIDRVKNSKLMKDDAGSINNKTTAQERIDAKAQVAKTEYKYKNTSANGTIRFNELNSKNSFQDINGERHPYQSDAKITVRNLDGTNETKTFSVKDIGSQKYFNDQLVRLGERGQVISAVIDQSPALAKTDLPTGQTNTIKRAVKPPVQDLPSVANRIAESQKQSQSEQSPVLPQEIQSTDTSAPRSSNKASATPNTANDTTTGDALTPKTYAETFGVSETQAKQDLASEPKFEAATRTEKSADANKLFESMKTDAKLTQATKEAQASGKEMNFYAKKDSNDRSVGIEQFNPKVHRIEAGFVVDEKGNVLGNHIKVDENGIQVNIGGKVTNMESVIGNPLDWGSAGKVDKTFKGRYKLSETMNRNIDNNAPNKKIANQTKTFLWSNKVKAEANMRTELDAEYKKLGDRIKKTNKAKPLGVSKQQYQDDIFAVLNGDKTDAQIKSEYDAKPAEAILAYKAETRTLYDSLLARVNAERIKFGQQPIEARKDYITHLQELNGNKGFVSEVYGQMKNSFADEGMGKTRDGVPGEIAGRTENFKPISKYNPFLQRRTGTKSLRDPYAAVQEYLQPALYNIHMTESGARARAIETAFRTAEAIKNTNPQSVLDEAKKITDKYKGGSDNAKLIAGFQEYANALAGKTQRFDRQVIDSSDAAAKGLKGWQFLQRTGGRATIVGNASSVLAQPLNQVVGLADAGPVNYMKGVAASIAGDPAIEKSDFIKARATEPTKAIRTKGEKVMDGGGVPLQAVELASVKLMWHTQHQKALADGYKGQEAIQQADLNTERLVAGRGIADKPELYRSTVANGVLQYTLEVNAQNKAFWQDLSPKQKATFLVGATATNTLMGAITGFEPLPDFLKALFDTGKELLDKEDERNPLVKVVKGGQRVLGEYASMNPLISGAVNTVLSDGTKKTIFGADSDLGRFPGETAPAGVIKNAVNAGSSLVKGDYRNARDSVFKIVPMGNQIRKTTQGAETLARGYAVDTKGERTFDAPTSPFQKGRTLLFGPSASTQASNYYDEKDQGLTKDQREQLRDAPLERRDEFKKQLLDQNKIADKQKAEKESNLKDKGSVTSKVDAINKESEAKTAKLKASLSPDDYEISNMTKEEKKKVVAAGIKTQAELDGLENFVKNKKKELGISTNTAKDLPKNINGTARKILDDENINDTEWLKKPNKDKDISNAFKSWLPKDIQSPPVNNEIAKDWANYEKKKAEGSLGKLEDESERKTILKKAYNSQLNEDERDLYSLSETRLKDSYNRGLINDQNINKALAVEKQLYDAGLIDKESLARKLDLSARGYKGSGSSRSKAQNNINSLTSDTLSRLNKLLAGTSKPVTGQKKVATKKPVLKKVVVKA